MRQVILLFVVAFSLSAVRADALTVREIIELSKAGLGDEVLVALIEVDGSVFAIDHETIRSLQEAGVTERVMIAMIKSGRTPPAAPAMPVMVTAPAPQVVIVEHHAEPQVREVAVPVAVPVYIPVFQRVRPRHDPGRHRLTPPNLPIHLRHSLTQPNLPIHMRPAPPKKAKPVYWGFGGKLRPDAWKPAGAGDR